MDRSRMSVTAARTKQSAVTGSLDSSPYALYRSARRPSFRDTLSIFLCVRARCSTPVNSIGAALIVPRGFFAAPSKEEEEGKKKRNKASERARLLQQERKIFLYHLGSGAAHAKARGSGVFGRTRARENHAYDQPAKVGAVHLSLSLSLSPILLFCTSTSSSIPTPRDGDWCKMTTAT